MNRYVWGKWLHCKKIVRKGILIELLKYMCPGMRVCDKVTPVIAERQSLRGIFMEYSSKLSKITLSKVDTHRAILCMVGTKPRHTVFQLWWGDIRLLSPAVTKGSPRQRFRPL